jgi:hypothetical protein
MRNCCRISGRRPPCARQFLPRAPRRHQHDGLADGIEPGAVEHRRGRVVVDDGILAKIQLARLVSRNVRRR